MFNPNFNQAPINILPKSVILLLCLIIFIELILQSGEKGLIGDQNSIAVSYTHLTLPTSDLV